MRSPTLSILMGAVSGVALALMLRYEQRAVFFVTLIVWLIALILAHWYTIRFLGVRSERLLFVVTALSFTGMISLVESVVLGRGLIILGAVLFAGLFAALTAKPEGAAHIAEKPTRRFLMLVWVFDAYAIATTAFAVSVFFPDAPFWLIVLLAAPALAYIACEIWALYYMFSTPFAPGLWWLLLTLLMSELMFVVDLLPFGYLAAGLSVAWVWYIIQLFIRFHLSSAGVIWRKQWRFLAGNAILFTLVLIFFVRWV